MNHLPTNKVTNRLIKRGGVIKKSVDPAQENNSWLQETFAEWRELGLIVAQE